MKNLGKGCIVTVVAGVLFLAGLVIGMRFAAKESQKITMLNFKGTLYTTGCSIIQKHIVCGVESTGPENFDRVTLEYVDQEENKVLGQDTITLHKNGNNVLILETDIPDYPKAVIVNVKLP